MYSRLISNYLKTYWLTAAFFGYLIFSVAIKSYVGLDYTIPCLIRYTTGIKCLGCGLTTAATHLLTLDFIGAYQSNPLIFIILPALVFLLINHWRKYLKMQQ
ncbi:DUF2752 domain-containing protein [Fulvivirga lutea]|uniref:DUF2752 domain-containing protein n=1 Tax=Fulvivirga lutea TaxID=2810512 RepID=A0A974WMR8_9BACT|nr:DUF2752 domain-containing protein [Fulvivirga lutea]QSE98313.1 DUF2752 domain-containing protein [Fulvivirga lutea]